MEKFPAATGTALARVETLRPLRQSMSTVTSKNAGSAGVVIFVVVSGPGAALVVGVATRLPMRRIATNNPAALGLPFI